MALLIEVTERATKKKTIISRGVEAEDINFNERLLAIA